HITIVKMGHKFEKRTAVNRNGNQEIIYVIDPGKYDDYIALLEDLREQGKGIDKIVHLWQWDSAGVPDFLDRGVYSLLYLVKAMAKLPIFNSMELWAVSRGLHKIESADTCNPGKAAILGPCKVIPQEYPHIKCRSIDFAENTAGTYDESRIVRTLLAEFWASPPEPIIAYRGVNRWVRSYEPVKLDKGPDVPVILREKGVYLVVGGLGNIGLSIAQYLAKAVHARLVLTSRSEVPGTDSDHPRRRKIKQLEEMGAEVSMVQVDAEDKQQLRQAIKHAEEKYGVLHGVLYAAGIMNESAFKLIVDSDRQDCEQHFKPKIRGLIALEEVLREKELDFCILTSSLSPILGGLSLYAYSAANGFMDGFAYKQSIEQGKNWISINWADWESNGGEPINDRCANLVLGSTVSQLNITTGEGMETFKRVLSLASGGNSIPGIVISSGDLHRRLQQWVNDEESGASKRQEVHKRPQLQSIYEAPQNEEEKIVAEIWQELLGIEMIGMHDNFFELGGHSLIATKLMSRLREIFRIDIPLTTLFDKPTIRGLVDNIVDSWGDGETVAEIARAYREVFSNESA
ncbi:MAG: hypothetical protein QG657_4202, partial [Acidobacteriota bacterium]|nr:hypothetical protein [Acidobacteriota bacterium]